ncbi:hypothetical protein HYDPIDRAFT_53733, partial [Hydnomerulius pinastri MD-312]
LATLWQRFGRAVRDKGLTGTAILLTEKDFFDDERATKVARKLQRELTRKRKASKTLTRPSPPKRMRSTATADTGPSNDTAVCPSEDSGVPHSERLSDGRACCPQNIQGVVELKDALAEGARARKQAGHAEKRRKRELDPAMDYLINAENRAGLMCRRKVFGVCFENDAADADHLECNEEQPMGCDRCRVSVPPVCCDLHDPAQFTSFTSDVPKPPSIPPRSHIPKYERMQHDHTLQDALDEWREQKTATVYGWHHLNDIGPSIIMCTTTLERIVDCAHHRKINSINELKRETGWPDADQFGNEVIAIIHRHAAPPTLPFVSTPLRPTTSSTLNSTPAAASSSAPKRKNKCGACRLEGHNARSRICLKHPSR